MEWFWGKIIMEYSTCKQSSTSREPKETFPKHPCSYQKARRTRQSGDLPAEGISVPEQQALAFYKSSIALFILHSAVTS